MAKVIRHKKKSKKSKVSTLEQNKIQGNIQKKSGGKTQWSKKITEPVDAQLVNESMTTVGVALSRTVNLGNFESVKVDVSLYKKCFDSEIDSVLDSVYDKVDEKLSEYLTKKTEAIYEES